MNFKIKIFFVVSLKTYSIFKFSNFFSKDSRRLKNKKIRDFFYDFLLNLSKNWKIILKFSTK